MQKLQNRKKFRKEDCLASAARSVSDRTVLRRGEGGNPRSCSGKDADHPACFRPRVNHRLVLRGSLMPRRYLLGPVTAAFADDHLPGPRQAGHCLAFAPAGSTDLAIGWDDTWEAVTARLPAGWRPDFILLFLPYTTVPRCLWAAPVPLVGWAGDANLLWH